MEATTAFRTKIIDVGGKSKTACDCIAHYNSKTDKRNMSKVEDRGHQKMSNVDDRGHQNMSNVDDRGHQNMSNVDDRISKDDRCQLVDHCCQCCCVLAQYLRTLVKMICSRKCQDPKLSVLLGQMLCVMSNICRDCFCFLKNICGYLVYRGDDNSAPPAGTSPQKSGKNNK